MEVWKLSNFASQKTILRIHRKTGFLEATLESSCGPTSDNRSQRKGDCRKYKIRKDNTSVEIRKKISTIEIRYDFMTKHESSLSLVYELLFKRKVKEIQRLLRFSVGTSKECAVRPRSIGRLQKCRRTTVARGAAGAARWKGALNRRHPRS